MCVCFDVRMSVGRYVCMHASGGHARCGVFCVCIVYVCTSKNSFVCQHVCEYACMYFVDTCAAICRFFVV